MEGDSWICMYVCTASTPAMYGYGLYGLVHVLTEEGLRSPVLPVNEVV